jgi:hypothetical protein
MSEDQWEGLNRPYVLLTKHNAKKIQDGGDF